jgi:hypothetical protein
VIIGGAIWGIFAGLFCIPGISQLGQYFRNPRLRQIGDISINYAFQLKVTVPRSGLKNRRLVCAASAG